MKARVMKSASSLGFTLIELLVGLSVAAVLVLLAAPSFKRMIDTQRLRGVNAALITDLQFARAEANSRNQLVYVSFKKTGTAVTCYALHTGNPTSCDCNNQPGVNVCSGSGNKEIRTVQIDRLLGITVGAPDTQGLKILAFDPATGRLKVVPVDYATDPVEPFKIEVTNPSIGGFVNSLEATGRPTSCWFDPPATSC